MPALLCGTKSRSGWRRTKPPVEEWVWVTFAGGYVGLGRMTRDGVWVQPEMYVMVSVTHWMPMTKPQAPCPVKKSWLGERRLGISGLGKPQQRTSQEVFYNNGIFPDMLPRKSRTQRAKI